MAHGKHVGMDHTQVICSQCTEVKPQIESLIVILKMMLPFRSETCER